MAYKSFSSFEKLAASEVNTYLMNQSIPTFADSTARDAAITSPANGQYAHLTGTNELTFYNGSAWVVAIVASQPWADFTPTFNGGFDVGTGSVIARYCIINNTLFGYVEATMGTGSSYGSGLSFDAPVASSVQNDDSEVGKATFKDGALRYLAGAMYFSDGIITRAYSSSLYLTSAAPFTPASGDVFSVQFQYEV